MLTFFRRGDLVPPQSPLCPLILLKRQLSLLLSLPPPLSFPPLLPFTLPLINCAPYLLLHGSVSCPCSAVGPARPLTP